MDELVKRGNPRLKKYDYNTAGAYFITMCTYERQQIFGSIPQTNVGAIHESPECRLSKSGKIVQTVIEQLPQRYDVEIPYYVIMPNHVHLIILIREEKRAIRE